MMVQKRQFRIEHPDSHYCSAIFQYMREYALRYRSVSSFVSLDDKHRIKIGEPGQPNAAVERGKRVLVGRNETFEVSDHDFCKLSVVPSVSFVLDIPEEFDQSWYRGNVHVGFKDAVFEPSSALRHVTELCSILKNETTQPVLFMYTDGGPDHRLTFFSVKLSLIALFRKLNLDLLIAGRTAPCNSWKNPVERIMSIVNLGLQCVGMMRTEGSLEFERAIKHANNLLQLREKASTYRSEVKTSLQPPIELLINITERLELKGKMFSVFESASEDDISDFWESLHFIDPFIEQSDTSKALLSSRPQLKEFMEHCCQERHYTFCIKKCGDARCTICTPPRMDTELFKTLRYLSDPMLESDGHYRLFDDAFKSKTSEKDRPSLQANKHKKSLSYSPMKQHATNVGVVIQCDECSKWRLLFSKRKLALHECQELEHLLTDVSYTCGAKMEDIQLPQHLECVEIRTHDCINHIEKLYYTAYPKDILCIHCGTTENIADVEEELIYPYCNGCSNKDKVYKRGAARNQ